MELEWEVFHVFADEWFDGAGLGLGEDVKGVGDVDYEVFVVLGKLESVFIEFWASEVWHFVDEGWVEVDFFDTCKQLLLYDSASEHFGEGLMAETHSQNLKFWV